MNHGARDILRSQGKLGDLEITCATQRGRMSFAEGDRTHFTKTDKSQGLMNGTFGTIEKIDPETKKLSILLDITPPVKQVTLGGIFDFRFSEV